MSDRGQGHARLAIVCAMLLAPAGAHTTGGSGGIVPCNNQARTPSIPAGWSNVLYGPCTSITITVGIATFQTPSQCPMGGAFYSGAVYTCGPASLGNHCVAQGYKVKFKTYDTGGQSNCPPLPTTTHFDNWESAMGLIDAWLHCPDMPVASESYDWSAKVRPCPGQPQPSDMQSGSETITAADAWTYWEGDPASLLTPPGLNPYEPLGPAPQVDPAIVEPNVSAVRGTQAPLAGASVRADFTLEWPATGDDDPLTRHATVSGTIAADGRFRLDSTALAMAPTGSFEPLTDELSFDGATFCFGTRDTPVYNAFASSSSLRDVTLGAEAPFAERLHSWLVDPCRLPALAAGDCQVETFLEGSAPWMRISRNHLANGGGLLGTTVVDVDISGQTWHPLSSTLKRPDGSIVVTRQFSEYEEIVAGNWRPTVVVERWMDAAGQSEVTATLRIGHMTALTSTEVASLPRAQSATNAWYVRR